MSDINTRHFSGSAVPLGSEMGKILINSIDASKVVSAARSAIKGQKTVVQLSHSTLEALRTAVGE